ncbi:hypothetical protein PJ985_00090 [Streptomyces sp. ACA25]|uniref:hypothetical protein n=1 Tax=Streptomyces sp. ACA25 TaxID=3022596 RepID=UPI0023071B29|nr:hypothetical protein [Streptomyces sp. ACA25]MDB1085988.1 hypothetical protein [Streptomyces sp. ACA25]
MSRTAPRHGRRGSRPRPPARPSRTAPRRPGSARTRRPATPTARSGGGTVRARFTLSELPLVTVRPAGANGAAQAAVRALAGAGRSHLGGRLSLTSYGPASRSALRPAAWRRAAARAVTSALAGGSGTVRLRLPPRS